MGETESHSLHNGSYIEIEIFDGSEYAWVHYDVWCILEYIVKFVYFNLSDFQKACLYL